MRYWEPHFLAHAEKGTVHVYTMSVDGFSPWAVFSRHVLDRAVRRFRMPRQVRGYV
jgi:hypothetical protein